MKKILVLLVFLLSVVSISTTSIFAQSNHEIPDWVKNNAKWWADGMLHDEDFTNGIEYLINNEIIEITNLQHVTNEKESHTRQSVDVGPKSTQYLSLESGQFEKPSRGVMNQVKISGHVDNFAKGDKIFLVIEKPNGEIVEQTAVSKDGSFNASVILNHDTKSGQYTVTLQHRNIQDSIIFNVIEKSHTSQNTEFSKNTPKGIPDWVKNNAKWWADGMITENDFIKGIEHMANSGIIQVKQSILSFSDSNSVEISKKSIKNMQEIMHEDWLCSGTARCFTGFVTQVIDGDTIKVDDKPIRFAMSSAPELNEIGGKEARSFIETICSVGSVATVDEDDGQTQGSYGRILGVVYCNGFNLNADLLDVGHGYLITDFCGDSEFANEYWAQKHGCSSYSEILENGCTLNYPHLWSDGLCYHDPEFLENGCPWDYPFLWSDGMCYTASEPTCPVDYPHLWSDGSCNTVPEFMENGCHRNYPFLWTDGLCYNIPEPKYEEPQCDPSYPDFCIPPPPPDLDCGDISHKKFTVLQPDPHRFDGDKDGIGCES